MGGRLTSIFVRQGHYAHDPQALEAYPPADLSLGAIGELVSCELALAQG